MSLNPELIHTKLHRPRVVDGALNRTRLINQLEAGLSVPLTLICAPAGFGKTTLISAWVEYLNASHKSLNTAWISIDKGDSDLTIFLRYFVGAIRNIFPDTCSRTQQLLRLQVQEPSEVLVSTLSYELSLLPSPLLLVLDDYHNIEGQSVHSLLSEMTRHWPSQLQLILISRSNPPLPLANLRAKSQVVEIRTSDLRFTQEEAGELLGASLSQPVNQHMVDVLQERTEGWVVGLQLAALSLNATDDANSLLNKIEISEVYIADYLVDEVLSQQPQSIQEFLWMTSILDRFCVSLCDAVTENPDRSYDSRTYVDQMERLNLFIVPLDNNKQWYRYHALFREMLHHRLLSEVPPAQLDILNRKAAIWFAEHDLIDEALRHAYAARHYELMATIMEQGLRDVLNREERSTLEHWLQMLPEEFIQKSPDLLMLKAWNLQLAWQFDSLNNLLPQIEALMSEMDESSFTEEGWRILRGQLVGLKSQTAFFANEPARAIALAQESISIMPQSWPYVRGGSLIYLGLGMQAVAQGRNAARMILDSYESLTHKKTSFGLRHLMTLCFVNLRDGLLEEVEDTARLMLELAEETRLPIHECWAHYFLGYVAFEHNELDKARQHFEAVIERQHISQNLIVSASLYCLGVIHHSRSNHAAAQEALELLSQSDMKLRGREEVRTRSFRARLLMLQENLDGASLWSDKFPSNVPNLPLLWVEEPFITKARILLARGEQADVQEALQILDSLLELAQTTFNIQFQIEILTLRALALDMMHDQHSEAAINVLREAVMLARVGGFIRVFIELGPPMKAMLVRLAEQNVATSFIKRVLAEFPSVTGNSNIQKVKNGNHFVISEFNEHLTIREIDVLNLMSKRLSDKEIASSLGISTTTVKRHAANIYMKLGVNKRWDAVSNAQALGILPAD